MWKLWKEILVKVLGRVLVGTGVLLLILSLLNILFQFPVTYRIPQWLLLTRYFDQYVKYPLIGIIVGSICVLFGNHLLENKGE